MDGDALALVENLDAAGGQPRLDLGAGEAVGDGIIVGVDVDVIVDADPAHAPLAVFVRLVRQRLERRAIDLLEQLAAGDAEPAQGLPFVELRHELAERGVDVGEASEDPAPEPAEQPALDDQDGLLDLRLGQSRRLRLVWARPASRCASRIPSIHFSGRRSSLSAAASIGARTE